MRVTRRSLVWLSAIGLCVASGGIAYGCGSSDSGGEQPPGTTDDGGGDVSIEGGGGTGGVGADAKPEAAPNCSPNGTSCNVNADCCTVNCDQITKTCANAPGGCLVPGVACATGVECCSGVCKGGVCGSGTCISDNGACTDGADCCSQKCGQVPDGGTSNCIPANPGCKTQNNECSAHDQCCSKFCNNGKCGQSSFCTQQGEMCAADFECCDGICTKQGTDAWGLCTLSTSPGTTGCLAAGSVCGGVLPPDAAPPPCGGACCSRACAPWGPTGVLVCQPPSGCRPTGEVCQNTSDCCNSPGMPGGNGSVTCSKSGSEPVGRCDNGNACRGNGAICKPASGSCSAENNCCAGNINQDPTVCKQDNLGIPRCANAGACNDAASYQGKPCASSADCCGLACVPDKNAVDGGAPFICGESTCVSAGGECTTDADCCPGLPCVAPPGSTKGICGYTGQDGGVPEAGPDGAIPDVEIPDSGPTCANYGQNCTAASDCCNNVPCTQGRCLFPIY
jgi:hypothetical protein